jgi:type II secretory pathway component PulK
MKNRRGVALIVVLWLVAALTVLMYAFLGEMQVEYSLASTYGDEKKAEQLAWSAIELACATVDNDTQGWQGPNDPWYDNPDQFYEVPFGDGAFTLLHPTYDTDGRLRWGLEDEASKINLNTATKAILMKLPRMTEQLAESILDWKDPDDNPMPNGAESSYYQGLTPGYTAKNAPFESVEELFYVQGITQEIMYGRDLNLNGRLESWEQDPSATPDPGLYGLVTAWSSDKNVDQAGQKRININTTPSPQLVAAGMTPQEAQIHATVLLAGGPFPNVAYLLGDPAKSMPAVLTKDRFKLLVDKFTVDDAPTVPGLVNINTAPRQVLDCLPGITDDLAVKIISARTVPGTDLSNMGWLTDVVTPGQLQQFASLITCRSYQFRIHAIGRVGTAYGTSAVTASAAPTRPGVMKRMIAVYDRLATPKARIVYWKDATRLGMPYDPTDSSDQIVQQ